MVTFPVLTNVALSADGTLSGITYEDLYDLVMNEEVVVLQNLFPKEQLEEVRALTHQWGNNTPQGPLMDYNPDNNHAVLSGISKRQKTSHNYHTYNFNSILDMPEPAKSKLLAVVEPLRIFQNRLTRNDAQYTEDEEGFQLHPQIIHYPSGGGHLDQHTHAFDPQRVGLILGISERGKDFGQGATYFEVKGEHQSSDLVHNIGDLLLFKFDIPHGISKIDEEETLDHASERGRWTLVMPYYSARQFYPVKTEDQNEEKAA